MSIDPLRRKRSLLGAAWTLLVPVTCVSALGAVASCSSDKEELPGLPGLGGSTGAAGMNAVAGSAPPAGGPTAGGAQGLPIGFAGASGATGPGACKGLTCQQKPCTGGTPTTVSGRVFDPSGTLPLYNVMVYVPNAPLTPLTPGATCSCEVSGEPVVSTITDTNGNFVLQNAPVGADIPLVVQIGKWRRKFTIPNVAECTDTAVAETLKLPGRQSEGDMPKIALTTGSADALECLLPKLGIDPAEFTNPDGTGRINYFAGDGGTPRYAASMNAGAQFPSAANLWGSVDSLRQYDAVLLSCEGAENADEKGDDAFDAMHEYANIGGRVFASHWHQVWFKQGPAPFPQVAEFVNEDDIGNLTADVVTSFPKGMALSQWLVNVQASTTPGQINITAAQHTVQSENPMLAQRWISSNSPASVQYLSANTPMDVPAAQQCGRVVLSDIHVAGTTDAPRGGGRGGGMAGAPGMMPVTDRSATSLEFPAGCVSTGLSPQEKVLAFMLFDITACLIPDTEIPVPPPIIVR